MPGPRPDAGLLHRDQSYKPSQSLDRRWSIHMDRVDKLETAGRQTDRKNANQIGDQVGKDLVHSHLGQNVCTPCCRWSWEILRGEVRQNLQPDKSSGQSNATARLRPLCESDSGYFTFASKC